MKRFNETEFRIAMARKGIRTVGKVGELAGITPTYARQIAAGLVPSEALRRKVAAVLGVEVEALWPSEAQRAA